MLKGAMASHQTHSANPPKLVKTCSIWRALEAVGDVPTLLILESIWLGDYRFNTIKSRTCLSKPLIAERLNRLVANDVLVRRCYCNKPTRYEYRLTNKGRDLFPVMMMLLRWENIWSANRTQLPVTLTHIDCGHTVSPEPICDHCRQIVRPHDIDWREGPGLDMVEADYTRRRQHRNRQAIAQNLSLLTDSAELLGDRWAGLVMRAIFTNRTRFDQILEDSAMASNILSDRLAWLVENGFLKARLYHISPDRFEYHATAKSFDYLPVLLMLQRWGDLYYGSDAGPPAILHHKTCGARLALIAGCAACHGELNLTNVAMTLSPHR